MRARLFAALCAVALPAAATRAEGLAIVDTARSPHAVVRPVGVEEVRWTDGFWAARTKVFRDRSIPAMWEVMRGTRYKPFLQHFLIAAGRAEGDYHGAAWNDGDFYKWIEAACASLAVSPNTDLEQAVAESVDAIAAAQRDDGYLHTPVLIAQRNGDPSARPFADRHDFEVYNMGHLMTTGCIHFRATGSRELLDVAEKAAGFLEDAFANPTPELARNAVCPSHYMGAVELYRTTGDSCYLRLAEKFLSMRNLVTDGGDDNQDRIPFLQQNEAVGHAVRANYLYTGAADLYLETGDPELWAPLEAVWENVVEKKLYVTGACGALYDGASPDGSEAQSQISRIHQAYGRNYQLPNTTAHNETCAAIGALMWNWRMFSAAGEAKYIDWLELALYNAVLSGVSLEGTEYFYVNPLRRVDPEPTELRWSRTREKFIVSYCCPPNVLRTIAELGAYAYSKSEVGVWVNLYGSSSLNTRVHGNLLRITQTTDYPWDGDVGLTIDAWEGKELTLHLRVPGWASGAKILVNGEEVTYGKAGGYAEIKRRWRAGDTVRFNLPMPVVMLESHPLVEETRNQVALKRGPIVYCLESTDLPDGVDLPTVALPLSSRITATYKSDKLGGVTVLEAELLARDPESWKSLYRPLSGQKPRPLRGEFVPYFAWGNRGKSEMTVWLPRD
ncbi:glycoside hydrolase family 127 protein [Pirellulimonas nuda]|nr:glycoside hydrolase family 127 protein [Pirellulimonas nuda]